MLKQVFDGIRHTRERARFVCRAAMLVPPGALGIDCIGFFLGSSQREISEGVYALVSRRYAGDARIKPFARADLARSNGGGDDDFSTGEVQDSGKL